MLRYHDDGRLSPMLTVVKTRGSDHDRGTHPVSIGKGGMLIEPVRATRPPKDK